MTLNAKPEYIASKIGVLFLFAYATSSSAAELSGTWEFQKAEGFYSQLRNMPPPGMQTLQIVDNRISFEPRCMGTYKKERYYYSNVFQLALKGGIGEKQLNSFLNKQFEFSLPTNGFFYRLTGNSEVCSENFKNILVSGDKLLVAAGAENFYSYVRSNAGQEDAKTSPVLGGLIPSHLPFNTEAFENFCGIHLSIKGSSLRGADKCSPVFHPYLASKNSPDKISQLVGNHDYQKGGASFAFDYSPPFENNLHPIFNVLPPIRDVLIVRVNDFESGPNENRDVMSPVYLSIKNGLVVDQLNDGCSFNEKYVCIDEDNKPIYQILDTGKFKKIK
ncbi:MAG TPA: hypothetical protein VGD52_19835 [Pseudoduganella sp.]